MINPFSDRLHQALNDIFIELNIDDSLIKELKDAKKNKRQRKQVSASKRTPSKAQDIFKSPNTLKKRRNINCVSAMS